MSSTLKRCGIVSCYVLFRLWQVFLDDAKRPGRLFLAKEQPSRFTLDDLDV